MREEHKASIMAMAALAMSESGIRFRPDKPVVEKNKFNLTPEEIESLEAMTPKEKKMFLRGKK